MADDRQRPPAGVWRDAAPHGVVLRGRFAALWLQHLVRQAVGRAFRPYPISFRQSFRASDALWKMCGATPRFSSDSPSFIRRKPLVV